MREQKTQTVETVTLLLETKQFKIDKEKLINKSRYFAALFSTSYSDYRLSEHIINYEIPLTSFQDFIDWINNDECENVIITSYKDNLERPLILLELSVLFAVDDLTKYITHILEEYLSPEDVLNIWLLAQELGLSVLQDLCLAFCLDRFTELPLCWINKLSRQNFLKLVGNINLRIANVNNAESYLLDIVQGWMKVNQDTIPLDILKKTGPKVFPSIVSCDSSDSSINNEFYIHCWDGDDLFELTTFRYPKDIIENKNTIIGMQISARGYNLYLSGGEFGIGSGRFNKKIWRYSLISKNWFLETTMPCSRRHMIAAFVQNTLLLVGGVGHYRYKLRSVDIYNLHKGTWLKGKDVPMEFVTVPEHYVFEKKLIICDRYAEIPFVYVYNSELNEWDTVKMKPRPGPLLVQVHHLCLKMPKRKNKLVSLYLERFKLDRINLESSLQTYIAICDNFEHCQEIVEKITAENFGTNEENDRNMYLYFIPSCNNLREDNVLICLKDQKCMVIRLKGKKNLQYYSIPIRNPSKFRSLSFYTRTVFFNLMNPANLHAQSARNLDCTICTHITLRESNVQ